MEYETEADKIQAMLKGTYEIASSQEDTTEDTDTTDDEVTEADTTDQIDGDDTDTADDAEADEEKDLTDNTLVDDNSSSDSDDSDDDEDAEAVDNTEPEPDDADQKEDTDVIDYEKEYKALKETNTNLQGFYDKVTADFKADGVMHKGFTDPNKIVQSNQMAVNYNGKMQKQKEVKPFIEPLRKRGMFEDASKFDLAMNIMDGDKEAIKQHLKNLEYDPITDLDLDTIEYSGKSQTSGKLEMAYADTMDRAKDVGVSDRMSKDVIGSWDNDSTYELINNQEDSSAIIAHMESGVFDAVQTRISEKQRTDLNGNFAGKGNLDQYKLAFRELDDEYRAQQEKAVEPTPKVDDTQVKAKVEQDAKDKADFEAYKAKMAENKVSDEARKKAAKVSKKKVSPKKAKAKPQAKDLKGDDFVDYWKKLERVGL